MWVVALIIVMFFLLLLEELLLGGRPRGYRPKPGQQAQPPTPRKDIPIPPKGPGGGSHGKS